MTWRAKLNRAGEGGFTLIEVLASLVVFSFAILGLAQSATQGAQAASALEDKALAGIVADNQLVLARFAPLKMGVQLGDEDVFSQRFKYRLETESTDISGFFRLTVSVQKGEGEQVILERVAYRKRES